MDFLLALQAVVKADTKDKVVITINSAIPTRHMLLVLQIAVEQLIAHTRAPVQQVVPWDITITANQEDSV